MTPNPSDLADALVEEAFSEQVIPKQPPKQARRHPWHPRMGPIGLEVLANRSSHLKFLYGERASTKTNILLHDLVLHCYRDFEATPGNLMPLAMIVTIIRSSATEGGAWEKLVTQVLPEWKEGIGLDYTEPRQDDQKNRYIFIGNQAGGWSRVVLKSIPVGSMVRQRLKNIEPSYVFFDELTEAEHPDCYLVLSQSLRRRPTGGPQQYVCAGNPSVDGEDHWTWRLLVQRPCEQMGKESPLIPKGGGRLQGLPETHAVWHVPLAENPWWSDEKKIEYQQQLMEESWFDPTAEDRIVKGRWTARPRGNSLFKGFYLPTVHVRGDALKGTGLRPVRGWPCYVGYDLGQVWNSITLLQQVPTARGLTWVVFDEVDHLGERVLYEVMAREVIERIRHWDGVAGQPFRWLHVADESAVNQFRPGGKGSYDALDFEREYRRVQGELNLGLPMRIVGCPKGPDSIKARVRTLQAKLATETLLVSAPCRNTTEMLRTLEEKTDDPETPKRGAYVHKFDSLTYPIFWQETGPRRTAGGVAVPVLTVPR